MWPWWNRHFLTTVMLTSLLNYKIQILLAFIFSLLTPVTIKNNLIQDMDRELEEWNLGLLEKVQVQAESELQPFKTDGCSGGLSEGWNSFSRIFPTFKTNFGDTPPWEHCCVEHDRAYWKGEVSDGYDKRLEADKQLRQCVIDYGLENSSRLEVKFGIKKHKIEQQFVYTGELMYQAVRVGGKPCSLLPWRWGYGWPNCNVILQPKNE